MLQKLKTHRFPLFTYVLTLLSSLFWVALRINHSGISKFLGADTNQSFLIMNLPVMVCVLSWLGFLLAVLGLLRWQKGRGLSIGAFVIGLITALGGAVVVYFGAWDYLDFILYHYVKTLAAAAALSALAVLLFFPVTSQAKPVQAGKWAFLLLAVFAAVVWGYQLRPCEFTLGPVVYAVEDEYQIVFSTSDSAVGWVTIGGQDYFDLYAGSARSADRVHKVTVPQAALDAAEGYTIHAQQMIYRGPFGGYKGPTRSQTYPFRPADGSDGLDYAALSDVHGACDAAAKAASDEKLDFVVLLGDMLGMVETEADAQFPNRLAHAITGGQIPVIYVRGNHEIKGEYAEVLYKYVGSKNQSFAYTVTLSDTVFAAVLDMGEDHEDDWWEYYGTAHFDLYRQQQTQMLERILAEGSYQNYPYRMALCHIPIPFIDDHGYFAAFRQEWTQLLNAMDMDISLSGHEHRVWFFLPDTLTPGEDLACNPLYSDRTSPIGTVTGFHFPTFLCGQRSMSQTSGTQKLGLTDYLCLHTHADLRTGTQTSTYVNSAGQTVPVVYPFACEGTLDETVFSQIETQMQ